MIFKNKLKFVSSVVLSLLSLIIILNCSGKKTKPEEEVVQSLPEEGGVPTALYADENFSGDSDSGKAMGLRTIHFGYDLSTLDEANRMILIENARLLKEHTRMSIQIEGHCDQKGSIQYNMALGLRRAHAVRHFLEDQGVASSRITVISFGKEKLIDEGQSSESHAKNRRANFVITSD